MMVNDDLYNERDNSCDVPEFSIGDVAWAANDDGLLYASLDEARKAFNKTLPRSRGLEAPTMVRVTGYDYIPDDHDEPRCSGFWSYEWTDSVLRLVDTKPVDDARATVQRIVRELTGGSQ